MTTWATVIAVTDALQELPLEHRLRALVAVLGKQVRPTQFLRNLCMFVAI
jgi:hypothetical protein